MTIGRLAAFGNTTPEARDTWRTSLVEKLGIAETWMPNKELKGAVRTIIDRGEIGSPENFITWLQRIDAEVGDTGQARKHVRSMIEYIRNTTGTHTDESLMAFLLQSATTREWHRPWRPANAQRTTPVEIDSRVLTAPVRLGIVVKTQPFAANGEMSRSGVSVNAYDGAWYNRRRDMIQIPDAARFETNSVVSGIEQFEHAVLHETCHAAWHPSRLDRDWRALMIGADSYASEEVVTDMAACLIERRLGKKCVDLWQTQADYVQSWLRRAGSSEDLVRARCADAVKVADYAMTKIDGEVPF